VVNLVDLDLIHISQKMQSKAYAPYSHFKVGAALLCGDGDIVTGCNVENASYGATICAERVAFAKAISKGKAGFLKIAISAPSENIVIPCGICCQFISEFVKDDFVFLCAGSGGKYEKYTLSQLLPYKFK